MREGAQASSVTLGGLAEAGVLAGDEAVGKAREVLWGESGEAGSPWFVRSLQVVGAWLAAMFFVGFMGIADLLDDDVTNIVTGAVMIAVTAGLTWVKRGNLFVEQALTALSIAGHLILISGVWQEFDEYAAAAVAGLLLPVTYPLFRVAVHRAFVCHFPAVTLFVASVTGREPPR